MQDQLSAALHLHRVAELSGMLLEVCCLARGLIAVVFALYDNKPARFIAETDAVPELRKLGLDEHLSPQRSNGLKSMIARMQADARRALQG